MSTAEPSTSPPPSTRSNSSIPDRGRLPGSVGTAWMGEGSRAGPASPSPRAPEGAVTASSTSESQRPQSGHRPSHLGDWKPQF